MKLQENIDYVLAKRAGYFGKSRLDQYHGNMIVTKSRIIINIIQEVDAVGTMTDAYSQSTHVHGPSLNPIKDIKNSVQDIKYDIQDMKTSMRQSKEEFRKLGDFGRCLKILKEVAADSETIEEFETRAAGMGEDNPQNLDIAVSSIQSIKFSFMGPAKFYMNDGTILKIFITKNKKNVKRFISNYVKTL